MRLSRHYRRKSGTRSRRRSRLISCHAGHKCRPDREPVFQTNDRNAIISKIIDGENRRIRATAKFE